MAYCLIGIFSVNMPLLYGEGERAFVRLQEHIIATNNDQSIFAWTISEKAAKQKLLYGLLASTPKAFANTGKQVSLLSPIYRRRRAIKAVNSTLEVGVLLRQHEVATEPDDAFWGVTGFKDNTVDSWRPIFSAVLDCQMDIAGDSWAGIKILLLNPQDGRDGRIFARINPDVLLNVSLKGGVMSNHAYHAIHGGPFPSQEWPASLISTFQTHRVTWLRL